MYSTGYRYAGFEPAKAYYVFLRKHLEEGIYQVSAVSASDVLKRNTDSLRCAVENDVFASFPQDSLLNELEMGDSVQYNC